MSWTSGLSAGDTLYDALMAQEDLIERLEDHHAPAVRFRRVLLDEAVARRVDLGDVASILDLPAEEVVALARGRPVEASGAQEPPVAEAPIADTGGDHDRHLDVRPLLDAGHDPLAPILAVAAEIGPGEVLVIEAPFHPWPLRRLLRRRGFDSAARELAPQHFRVRFRRRAG